MKCAAPRRYCGAGPSVLDRDYERLLEVKVKAECVFELVHGVEWNVADYGTDTFDCDGAHLFGLRLGVDVEAGLVSGKQGLERVDVVDVGRDGDDRHHALPESLRCGVGSVIADDDAWSCAGSFAPHNRVEVDESDLAAAHQASMVAVSQAPLSGSSDHSENAAA